MRKCFTILVVLIVFMGCHNNPSDNLTAKTNATDSLIRRFTPIINGDWVDINYINDLKKTKSAYQSYKDGAAGVDDEIYINTKNIAGDTLPIVIENGDGGAGPEEYIVFFKSGKAPNSLVILDSYSGFDTSAINLSFELTKTDTNLVLYRYDKNGTAIIYTRKYKRIRNELTNDDSIVTISNIGLSYFNNKIIVSGSYFYTDSLGKKHSVIFNDFGKVKGLEYFKTYYIDDVFSQGPGSDTDEITFNIYKKGQKDYIFKISKDTLKLFDFVGSEESDSIYSSYLKYTLVRQE